MADLKQLEFFLLRYVPDAVKNEFVNIGVVMLEPVANGAGFADVRFTRNWRRVRCLDPQADVEMLEALERDIRGQLRETHDREALLRKLEDSFSNVIQLSATKGCLAEDPAKEMETLASLYFEGPKRAAGRVASGRQKILISMRDAFEQAGISKLVQQLPVALHTNLGFKFDFGYRIGGSIKLFHAVSLQTSVDQAIRLASRYPKMANSIAQGVILQPSLTAVVDDGLDRERDEVHFVLNTLAEEAIQVAAAGEMPLIAERARRELRA